MTLMSLADAEREYATKKKVSALQLKLKYFCLIDDTLKHARDLLWF